MLRRHVPTAVLALAALLLPLGVLARQGFSAHVPPDARASLARADRALVESDLATAVREYERVAALAPEYAPLYGYYAYALATTDKAAAAAAAERYRRLAEATPERAAHWYAYGRFEQDRAKREAAFRKVIELEPNAPWGHLGLGFAARVAGENAKALPHYERALALAPAEPSVLNGVVALYAGLPDRKPRALALLEELFSIAPGSFFAENAFDAYAGSVTDPAEWPVLAELYIKSFPAGKNLGQAYIISLEQLAARDGAAAAFRARELLGTIGGPRYAADRGRIFDDFVLDHAREQGMPALEKLTAETLAGKEDSPYVFLALGRAYLGSGGDLGAANRLLARADELYRTMPRPDPAFGDALRFEHGRALERAGQNARAAEVLELVRPEAPNAAEVALLLASVHAKLGNTGKAFDASVRAAALKPLAENRDRLASAARAAGKSPAEADAAVWAIRDAVAKPAADFSLASLDAKPVTLAAARGKVVLLNFWYPG